MQTIKKREIWVDNLKILACIFVVLGHFFQSMVKSNIIPNNDLYNWFNSTISCFHVQLFFICSGFLYQKCSKVFNISSWKNNILKKAIALGVPYFTFSIITWTMKTLFSNSVNDEVGSLLNSLFINPISPYWYLYCLFFLFLITPNFKNKKWAITGLSTAIILKIIYIITVDSFNIYLLSTIFTNEIWFVLGMCICFFDLKRFITKKNTIISIFLLAIFITASIVIYNYDIYFRSLSFVLGLVACTSISTIFIYSYRNNNQSRILGFMSKYTMHIYLMHTIFAATTRIILMKIGVTNMWIHIILGIIITFVGPIVAGIIMDKVKFLDFFLHPNKYIKLKDRKTGD